LKASNENIAETIFLTLEFFKEKPGLSDNISIFRKPTQHAFSWA